MADFVKEATRELPVTASCDVLVAGGGVAGVAAALAAARSGADVLLVEKQCMLGGLATSGLVVIYLPLCDGKGTQMSYGIAEELLRLSIVHGAQERRPDAWLDGGSVEARAKQRFEVQFNPIYFAIDCERLLLQNGVRLRYDTRLCGMLTEGARAEAVIVESVEGRTAIRAKAIVDATGDAALVRMAGEQTRLHGRGNIVAGWYYASTNDGLRLKMLGFADAAEGSERDMAEPISTRRFHGDTAEEITEFLTISHKATLDDVLSRAARDEHVEPANMAHMPQFRMTRCLCGAETMKESSDGQPVPDSVGMVGDWRKRGPRFEVPYGALYGNKLENLFVAGRCISNNDGMWDIMRAIPCCAITGQAAGIAAALTPENGRTSLETVQTALRAAGQRLKFEELQ